MADDDENKPKKHTFESLYHVYANYQVISLDLDNEEYDGILLSQIDHWLDQAKLLRTVFSLTETGLLYMKFKKWRLDFEDFLEFLEQLAASHDLAIEFVKASLLAAGVPGAAEIVIVK